MKQIRESKFSKIIAYYLMIMMFLQVTQPVQMYALTSGPSQPEFNSFTPIETSDMVDLTTGDFNYNIPIMDVGGYPINLAYDSGITMDEEASWVGLGWNMNVGQIERQVRGLPDDFNGNGKDGDTIVYDNDLKENRTVGMNLAVNSAVFGFDALRLGFGLNVESNNYQGISFRPSYGVNYALSESVSVGMNLSSSVDGGATVSPSVGISMHSKNNEKTHITSLSGSASLGLNSRKGIENLNLSANVGQKNLGYVKNKRASGSYGGVGGSISFNDQSYTPSKRIGFENKNFSFNGALGTEITGNEAQLQVTGYGSYQNISKEYKHRTEKAYGYENTQYKGSSSGILDFNRMNERTVNANTTSLPSTNYTYDLYNIQGQGVSGMFRPYRSKVGNVYSDLVTDWGSGKNFGAEVGIGQLIHGSGDFRTAPSKSWTGPWSGGNTVLPYFKENHTDAHALDYETYAFKMVGSMSVDPQTNDLLQKHKAFRIGIQGKNKNSSTTSTYHGSDGATNAITKIERAKRYARSQSVQKLSNKEAVNDPLINRNSNAKAHHTAGMKILKTDGSTYVYGTSAYSTKKVEATFDVSNKLGNNTTGLVEYNASNGDIKGNSTPNSDRFLNKVTTPGYAHSFMLSSVLSADYEDVDNNGPTLNDLGTFTKFEYKTVPKISGKNYQWRVPFAADKATYNEGLISDRHDQKGNYIYGEKELVYLDRIVTKTHVAFFDLEDRKDAIGVAGEEGGAGSGRMKKIKSIRLYSRPEATNSNGDIVDPQTTGSAVKPIKTAHFIYSYNLCKGVHNNSGSTSLTNNELSNNSGKLTLEKVYFTYRGSNMGKYTPYVFNYGVDDTTNNPGYDIKGFDIWGNFKLNPDNSGNSANDASPLSNTEFPYVKQNKADADKNVQAWELKTVRLPSGGIITIKTESDDYRYVQNKKAMQLFDVIGAGNAENPIESQVTVRKLYEGNDHKKYLYVKLDDANLISNVSDEQKGQWVKDNYLRENYDKPIQFKFLLNMRDGGQYDYVSGYFRIKENLTSTIPEPTIAKINVKYFEGHGTIAILPLEFLKRDGGTNGNAPVNPIAKSGWAFGRTHLNRIVYGLVDDPTQSDFKSIIKNLKGSIVAIKEIFTGPNKALQSKGCAMLFKKDKSWVRLENKDGNKLGGGSRVKSIQLSDNWGTMVAPNGGTNVSDMEYGQTFTYTDESGKSSGVATFEPNSCAENPFVEPVYASSGSYAETIAAPKENNYVEKPFGENFFPAPKVTYSMVTVKNDNKPEAGTIKKHATGKIVTEHYTSYDFPTRVDQTKLEMINDLVPNSVIGGLMKLGNLKIRNHLTLSQGYSIETNDMDGKIKKETVYDEGNSKISSVEYKYSVDDKGQLDNYVTTIDPKGNVEKKAIGVDYDMINDFNESYSATTLSGFDANVAAFMVGPTPTFVPTVFPKKSFTENKLRTVVTTKHTHKTGIMLEKIATDLGASVSTKNLAWDAGSGDVILTGTVNEYGNPYYSFSYPAYWMYQGMGPAADNLGIEGVLKRVNECSFDPRPYFKVMNPQNLNNTPLPDLTAYFHPGDELLLEDVNTLAITKVWVMALSSTKNGLLLMDGAGNYIDNCGANVNTYRFKIMRSGYRNLQSAMMASVTSMVNPLKNNDADPEPDIFDQNSFLYNSSSTTNPRIINASAVVYKDFWKPQKGEVPYWYPRLPGATSDEDSGEVLHPYAAGYNPYLWNTKGDWKAEKSYAYLGGRKTGNGSFNNPRSEGFFTAFSPFYQLTGTTQKTWTIASANWTYASSVTQFSPFGMELENKDALNRYSSAQYGYQNKLPMAVASNSKYNEMGFEGFEEKQDNLSKHFVFNGTSGSNRIPVTIDSTEWHTGKRSVKVTKTAPVKMVRKLKPPVVTAQVRACDYNCSQIMEITLDGTNVPVSSCTVPSEGIYTRYKLKTKCESLKVSGDNLNTTFANFIFSPDPDPQNPNGTLLTIRGYLNLDSLPLNHTSADLTMLIPVKIDGVFMNLSYRHTTFQNPNGNHCFNQGELKCP